MEMSQVLSESIKLSVLGEGLEIARSLSSEYAIFSCKYLYMREVEISLGDTLLMLARSVMPKTENFLLKRSFRGLGDHHLGSILFTNKIKRSPYKVAKISVTSKEDMMKKRGNGDGNLPAHIWGRQSTFEYESPFLLLTEFFSPEFWVIANRCRT